MYSTNDIKRILKNAVKYKKSLLRVMEMFNNARYTEQNEEELNNLKCFVSYKIDLLNDLIAIIRNGMANKIDLEELSISIHEIQSLYKEVSSDSYLSRLEQIYTRNIDDELTIA